MSEHTSLQPFGPTRLLVCFTVDEDQIYVTGAHVNGEVVSPLCFSADTIVEWNFAVEAEYLAECREHNDSLRIAALLDRGEP